MTLCSFWKSHPSKNSNSFEPDERALAKLKDSLSKQSPSIIERQGLFFSTIYKQKGHLSSKD